MDDAVEPPDVEPPDIEPWLRGPLGDVHPLVAPTLHAYAQAREDIARWTKGFTDAEIWLRPNGLAPIGFQLRHIAGSVERLTTYLRGEQLTGEQLEAIRREMDHLEVDPDPGRSGSLQELLSEVNEALRLSEQVIRAINPGMLTEPRSVGRKHLPTTVVGLVVHLAEHTQRHVGELIITAKVARRAEHGRTSPSAS
jgi:DinB superfamily